MPEFFLELLSEEIPAGLQKGAMPNLWNVVSAVGLETQNIQTFYGPRRIAVSATVAAEMPGYTKEERGPRETAPAAAVIGFLNKHNASREELITEAGYYILRKRQPSVLAKDALLQSLPGLLLTVVWRKSMRWGQSGDFTWVRPLRRIVCLLDGEVIPFKFGPVIAGDQTEGHRVPALGAISVSSAKDWERKLHVHHVIANHNDRLQKIVRGMAEKAAEAAITVAEDDDLLNEVAGLIEWPVPLIGRIDQRFMDLPPEVRELSMKVNQKYFALRDADGNPAPYFAFVANLEASDGGAAIVAGNERVLRARLSDARYFWDLDLKTPLNELLPKLEQVTFHAGIGTQKLRAERVAELAAEIADALDANKYEIEQAHWAGMLCKADLVTSMVGEFPELQGIIGGYYAEKTPRGWDGAVVGPAIKSHYQPKGPKDAVPSGIVPVSVALADKLYTLNEFFRIGETPSGSGDPYALRRSALGVIRIILEAELTLPLKPLMKGNAALFDFIIGRLRVKLRAEGKRFDIVDAVLSAGADDDLLQIMKKAEALDEMLGTMDGKNLLAAYRRAANILRIETAKDGPYGYDADQRLFNKPEEHDLFHELTIVQEKTSYLILDQSYATAMSAFAKLRGYIDAFFNVVTVNDSDAQIRGNRLALLSRFCNTVHQIADFSKLEG